MIASLIERHLARAYQKMQDADANPVAAQAELLARQGRALYGTGVAALQQARIWQGLEEYRQWVRITEHDAYADLVDDAMAAPLHAAFELGVTQTFAHSASGTKYTPFTRAHVANYRSFQKGVLAQAVCGAGQADLLRTRTLIVQGNLDLGSTAAGAVRGYSTAVMIARSPWWLRQRLTPSFDTLRERDLDKKLDGTRDALLHKAPLAISGIPRFLVGALHELIARNDEHTPRVLEALKKVKLYAWSGTPLGPSRAFVKKFLHPDCKLVDAFTATEGPIGFQAETEGVYRAALSHSVLLFTPPGDPGDRRFAWELREGRDYDVYLGSFAGYQGYKLGDRIRVVSRAPLRFQLLPRDLDVDAAAQLCGGDEVTDLCAYRDAETGNAELVVESPRLPPPEALVKLAALLGARSVRLWRTPEGMVSREAVKLSAEGLIKLPWLHSRPELHARLVALASESSEVCAAEVSSAGAAA